MWIKRFRANDLGDAIGAVRSEFGPEALILSTRTVRKAGLMGLLRGQDVEVTAAVDGAAAPSSGEQPSGEVVDRFLDELTRVFPSLQPDKPRSAQSGSTPGPISTAELDDTETKHSPHNVAKNAPTTPGTPAQVTARSRVYNLLTSSGVRGVLARRMVNEAAQRLDPSLAGDPSDLVEVLANEVHRDIVRTLGNPNPLPDHRLENGTRPLVGVLVGPTGVGKTTTIAKLAARYALEKDWSVELLTCDTFRVAAIDQLTQYAELIGVPVNVATTPAEAAAFVERSRADLVLVDTAGRSHLDGDRMEELNRLVDALAPTHTFLCVSLTSRDSDAFDILEYYRGVGINNLILTKLDETRQPGLSLSLAARAGMPVSYVTTGQQVPADLDAADPSALASRLLEGTS